MFQGHDYPDRLNPFLVKELRVGLRAKGYVTVFLFLLAALTVHALAMADNPDGARFGGAIFKAIVYLTLVFIMPLCSLGALAEERRGRKLEPLILSPLTARGLVYGKWLVVASQSVVLASLTAPFIVIQYFNGGVNIADDLAYLVIVLCTGLVFTAVTLAASGLLRENNSVINILIRVITVFGLIYAGGTALAMTLVLGFAARLESWAVALIAPFAAALCVAVFLEIAALTLGMNFGTALSRRNNPATSP